MEKEPFFGIIKIITGEEIISKIYPYYEEQGFVLLYPYKINTDFIETPQGIACRISLYPWFKLSKNSSFFIHKNKIISIGESEDKLSNMYNITIKNMNNVKDLNEVPLSSEMGLKTTVEEARLLLENIFTLNIESKDNI